MHVHSSVGASKKEYVLFFALLCFFCFSHVWNFHQENSSKLKEFLPISAPISSGGASHGHWDPRTLSELVDLFFFIPNQEIFINGCFNARTINLNEHILNKLYYKRKNFGLTLMRETYALLTQQSRAYSVSITYVLVILSHRDAETGRTVHA